MLFLVENLGRMETLCLHLTLKKTSCLLSEEYSFFKATWNRKSHLSSTLGNKSLRRILFSNVTFQKYPMVGNLNQAKFEKKITQKIFTPSLSVICLYISQDIRICSRLLKLVSEQIWNGVERDQWEFKNPLLIYWFLDFSHAFADFF